jgi:hypothetical protein
MVTEWTCLTKWAGEGGVGCEVLKDKYGSQAMRLQERIDLKRRKWEVNVEGE